MSKRKKQATEELVQTQVLNIEEVRRVANYEKKLSKKPAAICAILGVFMILIGGASQGYISYNEMMMTQNTRQKNIAARKVETKVENNINTAKVNSTLNCIKLSQQNPDGTNYAVVFTYNFVDNKLKKITKEFQMDGYNPAGVLVAKDQMAAYQSVSTTIGATIPGYTMETGDRSGVGFYNKTTIDLTLLNPSMVPEIYNTITYISVDHKLDEQLEAIQGQVETDGFICTLTNE